MATRKESASEILTGKPDTQHSPEDIPMDEPITKTELEDVPDFFDTGATPAAPSVAPSLDELGFSIDHEAMSKTFEESFLPTGDYAWLKDRQLQSPAFSERDKREGDVSPKGRMFVSIFGKVESKNGQYSDYFKLTVSPDMRFRKDEKGNDTKKPDGFSDIWKRANDLYFALYEKNPEQGTQVVQMLLDMQYYIYITRSPRGNFVNGLKKA